MEEDARTAAREQIQRVCRRRTTVRRIEHEGQCAVHPPFLPLPNFPGPSARSIASGDELEPVLLAVTKSQRLTVVDLVSLATFDECSFGAQPLPPPD